MVDFLSNVNTQIAKNYEVKFYIKDTAGKWVDFSDKGGTSGIDALKSVGKIVNKIEESFGVLVTTVQNIVLENSDGFFHAPFPSTLKAVDGTAATFDVSKNFKRSLLRGRECKISVRVKVPNTLIETRISELIFLAGDRDFSGATNWSNNTMTTFDKVNDLTVTATVSGLFCSLAAAGFSGFRAGQRYTVTYDYVERVPGFRLETSSGQIIGSASVGTNRSIIFTATSDATDFRVASSQSSGTADGDFDNFVITKHQEVSPSHSIQEEPMARLFIDDVTPNLNKKEVVLRLISLDGKLQEKEALSVKDGFDWYKFRPVSFLVSELVRSEFGALPASYSIPTKTAFLTVDGDNAISNLGRPPLWGATTIGGTPDWQRLGLFCRAIASGQFGAGTKYIYLGCDEQLWRYDPLTGLYEKIGAAPAGYYIKHLEWEGSVPELVVYAWKDEYWPDGVTGSPPPAFANRGWDLKIYTWNDTTLSLVRTDVITSMQYFIRVPSFVENYSGGTDASLSGFDIIGGTAKNSENMTIPFAQSMDAIRNTTNNPIDMDFYINTDGIPWKDSQNLRDNPAVAFAKQGFLDNNSLKMALPAGAKVAQNFKFPGTLNRNCAIKYTVGQGPAVVISRLATSSRKVAYWWKFNTLTDIETLVSPLSRMCYEPTTGVGKTWWSLVGQTIVGTSLFGEIVLPDVAHQMMPLCMDMDGVTGRGGVFLLKQFGIDKDFPGTSNDVDFEVYFLPIDQSLTDPSAWTGAIWGTLIGPLFESRGPVPDVVQTVGGGLSNWNTLNGDDGAYKDTIAAKVITLKITGV